MHLISGIVPRCVGLCRKLPAVHILHTGIGIPMGPSHEGPPDRGAGRAGTFRRGAGAALSGIGTLIHNPRLLLFPLAFALVFTGICIIVGALYAIPSSLEWRAFIDPLMSQWRFFTDPTITRWYPDFYPDNSRLLFSAVQTFVLTFGIEFITICCLVILTSSLILCLTSRSGAPTPFFHGLARAAKYLKPLAGLSAIMAFTGSLLVTACYWAYEPGLIIFQFLSSVFNYTPFNFLDPNLSIAILSEGAFELSFTPIYYGLKDALVLSAINILLFTLTLFVVPLLVIEEKSLREAVMGSFALMRSIKWEIAICILSLGVIIFTALLASLLFPAIAGGNIPTDHWSPPHGWLVGGVLYVLALTIVVVVVVTAGGIAMLNLYRYVKTS